MIKRPGIVVFLFVGFILSNCYLVSSDPLKTPTSVIVETVTPTMTQTIISTSTIEPTATLTSVPSRALYIAQPGTPAYIKNFAHPAKGCNWLGVAGQVFGPDGLPVLNLIVSVKGKLDNTDIDVFSMTGLAEGDAYGPGGYEIKLANQPYLTDSKLAIQVYDLSANPLTDPFIFNTTVDCEKNLVIINFTTNQK